MRNPNKALGIIALLAAVLLPVPLAAQESPQPPAAVATLTVSPVSLNWTPLVEHDRLVLTVTGPEGFLLRQELEAGKAPSLSLFDPEGNRLPDGSYSWELRVIPRIDPGVRERISKAREAGEEAVVRELKEAALSKRPLVQSGNFFIRDGSFVVVESPKRSTVPRPDSPVRSVTANDLVETGNLIVQKNACIGESCSTSDADFPALKLKAPEIGILFDDVEVISGLVSSSRNWALVANPSGADQFSLFDVDNSRALFTVVGDAPGNSLYVASNGHLGLGTATPAQDLHAISGNSPAIRLEQDGSGSLTPRTWDVGANDASFFVRDVTNSSSRPLQIQAGAPANTLYIASNGRVGVGTSSPGRPLEVARSGAVELGLLNSATTHAGGGSATPTRWFVQVDNDPNRTLKISKEGTGGTEVTVDTRLDANGATLKVDGSVQATNVVYTSSRDSKKDFKGLEPQDVLARVAKLPISEWSFKEGPEEVRHIGPMAEDFYDAFGLSPNQDTISVTDTSGVALVAIQALLQRIEELEKRLRDLEKCETGSPW